MTIGLDLAKSVFQAHGVESRRARLQTAFSTGTDESEIHAPCESKRFRTSGYRSKSFRAGIAAFLLSSAATDAVGQTAVSGDPAAVSDQDQPLGLEEIVVTAQGRQQRLQDVPVAVTVTSGEALERANITGLAELSARLPAVRITPAPGADLLNIRGIGSGLNPGMEQSVGTFVDGAYRGRSRATRASLFDIDRVEVLKGPQTTFFGNNTIAGAFNITTRKPSNELSANASLLYGPAFGEYEVEGGVGGPVATGLNGRVAARLSGMDGFSYNRFSKREEPRVRDLIGRIALNWRPNDKWEGEFRTDYVRNRARGSFYSELLNCPPDPAIGLPSGACLQYLNISSEPVDDSLDFNSDNRLSSRSRYEMFESVLMNRLNLDDFTVSALTSYFWHDVYSLTNIVPIAVPGVGGGAKAPNASFERYRQFSQELRLESSEGKQLEYLLGAYFAKDRLNADAVFGLYFAPLGAAAAPIYNADTPIANHTSLDQDTATYSAFASGTLNLTSSFRVSLGIRYTRVEKDVVRGNVYGTAGLVPDINNFIAGPSSVQTTYGRVLSGELGNYPTPKRSDAKVMPSASVQYKITPRMMAYASYTKGFKAGGYALGAALSEFGPETVDAFEVGLKGQTSDNVLSYNLDVFSGNYRDLQESTNVVLPNGSVVSLVRNVARARSRGVEAGLRLRVGKRLSFFTDLAYLDAEYSSYPNAPCTALQAVRAGPRCVQDLSGKQKAFAPEFSGNLGATYRLPLDKEYEIRFEPNLYFSSSYFQSATADALLKQPSYLKIDARLGLGKVDGLWEFAIIGKNLTDQTTASFRNNVPTATGSTFALPDAPRSVSFQLAIRL